MLSSILSRFKQTPKEELNKPYGEVKFNHLSSGHPDVIDIGIYDPDLLRIALNKFMEQQTEIIESVRLATYPRPGTESPYLLIQDEYTDDSTRWFALAPMLKM